MVPASLHHKLEKRVKIVHDVVPHAVAAGLRVERGEELAGALDLGVLDTLELKGGQRTLGLSYEVDVLDLRIVVAERDRPVGL